MMRRLAVLLPILTVAQLVSAEEPVRERIEWADVWVTNADKEPVVMLDQTWQNWRFNRRTST